MQSSKHAKYLRRQQTDAERKLWSKLRNRSLFDCKFRRQFPIGPYIADFACYEAKLVVELDGGQHALNVRHDEERGRFLATEGYKVLRFWNCDVLENMDGVLIAVAEALAERGLCGSPHPTPLPEGEGVRQEEEGSFG